MNWNWENENWPEFAYDQLALRAFEESFIKNSGILLGVCRHLDRDEQNIVRVNFLSEETLKTSEIEGEYLDRESIQSSIRFHFGLQSDRRGIKPAELGVSEMMIDLYETFAEPLTHNTLWRWQKMLCGGRRDLKDTGCYRSHTDPTQIVSGSVYEPKIHFVAPPSSSVEIEMDRFMRWFNASAPSQGSALPTLTRAGIAHLHFVSIHPFEDGNGRLARALAEKSLAQAVGHPTLIALSQTINKARKEYYKALEQNSSTLDITAWLVYFSKTVLAAQVSALQMIEFIILKGKFLTRFESQINNRQLKVLVRMFEAGPEGFKGGLSAANYMSITKTSSATTTRDLKDLVAKGALTTTGQRKHTRYDLKQLDAVCLRATHRQATK
ncbi:MAG: Fic family protein [Kiritimatiellia bacterium]